MKKMKLGILGLGGIGIVHLSNCRLMGNLDIAVADKSKTALAKAKEMGVTELYTSMDELIEKSAADAVMITLPNFLHKESACLAAEKGLDIFVEKPLAKNAQECQDMIQSANKNNVKLMVGFYRRFIDRNKAIKSMIEEGVFGDITLVTSELMSGGPFYHRNPPHPVPEWWFDPEKTGGGVLPDTGVHAIDLLRWLLQDEASVEHVYFDYKYRLPLEDTAVLNLEFSRGTEAILTTGWFEAKEVMDRIAVFGTAGSKSFEGFGSEMSMKRAISEIAGNLYKKLLRKKLRPYSLSQTSLALYRELEHFVDCVIEDKEPLVTGKDGLECAKIIDKAYQLWRSTNPANLL